MFILCQLSPVACDCIAVGKIRRKSCKKKRKRKVKLKKKISDTLKWVVGWDVHGLYSLTNEICTDY